MLRKTATGPLGFALMRCPAPCAIRVGCRSPWSWPRSGERRYLTIEALRLIRGASIIFRP